ncbi:MAG: mechanosensitive ion channel family protein [Agitococcus sp.]|nr:mechanosensitive ion channel family protein [Agitococcus sp.]MDO9177044.1 mechanosensitive ion channel family protein [Agitococcus sp.]
MLKGLNFSVAVSYFTEGAPGRLAFTLGTILVGILAYSILLRILVSRAGSTPLDQNRHKLVLARNIVVLGCIVTIFLVWASSLTHLALSLAAVAGAILIVFKELILCWLGYFLLNVSRLYGVGDYIEIGGLAGRVIDISAFSTNLAEEGGGHQLTGKTVNFPNSLILTQATKNVSATGKFIINLYRLPIPYGSNILVAEQAAILAAQETGELWHEEAGQEFERIEAMAFLNLPSTKPKVIWEPFDHRQHYLHIRFACPMENRVAAEQVLFRKFWGYYQQFSEVALSAEDAH